MPTDARHLRAIADNNPANHPSLTPRERQRRAHIVATATQLMATYGRHNVTMGTFALALHMAPATIRRHFADLDTLLAEILVRHLKELCAAIATVPYDTPNAPAARRAAYIAATRTSFNGHVPRHTLLLRDRHLLPADLLEPIDQLRLQIGQLLAGVDAEIALTLLDEPALHAPQVEMMLAALPPPPQAEAPPKPTAPVAPPPKQKASKQFFFEKKNQKTFAPEVRASG